MGAAHNPLSCRHASFERKTQSVVGLLRRSGNWVIHRWFLHARRSSVPRGARRTEESHCPWITDASAVDHW